MEILAQIGPIVVFIIGMFLWVRAIYERADKKREALAEKVDELTTENLSLKSENEELKRMNIEWRRLANKYHDLAVKWYTLTQDMIKKNTGVAQPVVQTTNVFIPTPDAVMDGSALLEEIENGSNTPHSS